MAVDGLEKTAGKRRRLQFSLRTLLIAVLALGFLLGLLGSRALRARRQRKAIEELAGRGALVMYDYESAAVERQRPLRPPVPQWLCTVFGVDFFADVVFVGKGGGSDLGQGDLIHLKAFPDLEELQLYQSDVTDDDLAHLAGLGRLRWLDLSSDEITDEGLKHLMRLSSLEEVSVGGEKITDIGVARLREALPDAQVERYAELPDRDWSMPQEEGSGKGTGFF
jgi:hypothetical protein